MFTENANRIFNRSIEEYHRWDDVDHPIDNPYAPGTIDHLLYHKNWIDTVQWHLEDIIRDPAIDPAEALLIKRRIDKSVVYRALAIVTVAMLVVVFSTSVILLSSEDQIGAIDALFESVSAFGTVGLTTGITQILSPISKICLCLTMFIGRVGPVSLGLAIAGKKNSRKVAAVRPEGKVIVG